MKVLLLGEFSSFHNHLAAGLRTVGVDAVVAAGGDGYKKIQCDLSLESNYSGSVGRIDRQIKPFYKLPKLTGFDVCQSVSTMYPEAKLFSKTQFYRALKRGNKKLFFAAAGTDPTYCERAPRTLKYTPLQDFYIHDVPKGKIRNGSYYMLSSKERKKHDELIQLSDGIIPVMYDYAACYQSCNKVLDSIPLPLDASTVPYTENIVSGPVRIFHGLSRYGFKGTAYIERAFTELERRFGRSVELIIAGRMPINEYLQLLQKSNVVIDQVNSYSPGMNGLYAMAMGKVVMSGAEKIAQDHMGEEASPVINVTPSVSNIVSAVERVLDSINSIIDIGRKSRDFVERHHSHIKVANAYLSTWNM